MDCLASVASGAPAARRRRAQGRRPGRRLRRPLPRPLALARADAEPGGMEKLGKLQGKPWKNHGKTMGKPWKHHGNTMETPWKNHGKTMEKPMETYGNLWKAMENLSLGEKMLFLGSLDRR